MDCTILGTGAAIPTADRVQTGYLFETPDGSILLDCGSGVMHRLSQLNVQLTDIEYMLLSHTHLDHIADLPSLAKARYLQDSNELTIIGPIGTASDINPLFQIDNLISRIDISIEELPVGTHTLGTIAFQTFETVHSRTNYAYRFGDALGITGDGEATPELYSFFDGVDVLIADCAYPEGETPENHPTPSALANALEAAEPTIDSLYLTHFYPEAANRADEAKAIVQAATDASVHIATDLDTIALED